MRGLRNVPVLGKLALLAAVAVLGVVSVAWAQVAALRPDLLSARETATRDVVQSAVSVVESLRAQVDAGGMTEAAAKSLALAELEALRYDGQQYVWVNDMTPRMLMHPVKPEMNGQDLTTTKDPNGVALFVEFANTVRAHGSGFVTYLWPKPGFEDPVPKLSYVAGVPEWGWVIGTGLYLDDVDAAVADARRTIVLRTVLVIALLLAAVVLLSLSISRPLRALATGLGGLAAGEEDVPLPEPSRDEVGRCVEAAEVLRDGLAARRALVADNERLQAEAEESRRRTTAALSTQLRDTVDGAMARISQAVDSLAGASGDLEGGADRLVGSVDTIGEQAGASTRAAGRAAEDADSVATTVIGLSDAADRIGGVVDVIRKVAFQTNLLALNATIEAARAGEAGRGFAVVAHEVQELARQSADASDRIAGQVQEIQGSAGAATEALTRIADAVRGLGDTTREVSRSLEGDGDGDGMRAEVSANRSLAGRVHDATATLAHETERLRAEVDDLAEQLIR